MKLRLQTRYLLAILSLVAFVIVLLAGTLIIQYRVSTNGVAQASARFHSQDLMNQLVERGVILSETLAETLTNPLYEYDMERMGELLATALNQADVVHAMVVDGTGALVHDGSEYIPEFGERSRRATVQKALRTGSLETMTDGSVVHLSKPMQIGDEVLGVVHLGLSRTSTDALIGTSHRRLGNLIEQGLRWNLYTVLVTALVLIALAVVVANRLARNLTDPIRKLARLAGQIGHGTYPEELQLSRNDEIAELADSFNEMSRNLQQTTEAMRHMAYHDSLTGLPNRAMFQELLSQAVRSAVRHEDMGALMFVDLDHFKRINDTLGHQAGDALLCQMAKRLDGVLRSTDVLAYSSHDESQLARLGGDEFTVLLPRIRDSFSAALVAQRLLEVLGQPSTIENRSVVVTASIGITIFPTDAADTDELLKNADMALYHAKDAGRNTYHYFVESMNESAVRKLELESELRRALENEEFELYYQPQVNSDGDRIVGAEALIRWHHSEHGLVSPGEFIPVAEETGIIGPIGDWVMDRACRDAARWRENGFSDVYVSVNVSAVQFRKPSFVEDVATALEAAGLEPQALHIELTESSLMQDEAAAERVLATLQELGVEVWMDDFGTGYSSLSYLRRYPFRGVKIDYSFVRDIVEDPDDRAIASAIIAMANSLRINVTAEGVESENQVELLQQERCHRLQGFLFGRPMPAAELVTMLQRASAATSPGGVITAISE